MDYKANLSKKILSKKAVVGVIGIGYVGGALAKGANDSGFCVIGFTRSEEKAKRLNKQKILSYKVTADDSKLLKCDIICICVPTPVKADKTPDIEPVVKALEKSAKYLHKGTLVIIESTVAPGTTRDLGLPILKKSKLKPEKEFFLAFSPERVDPGNKTHTIYNTPKVVSGLSDASCGLVTQFYQFFIEKCVPVSSLEVAEMSKILENTFRLVNISLVNELLDYTNALRINIWEVINASATKPFGFLPHYPSPGVGGHCIPVDPYYLLDDAKKRGVKLGIVEQAERVNNNQPKKVVKKAVDIIKQTNGVKQNHSALIIGISYKEDIEDRRESPSIKIWELLKEANIAVSYHDPYIPEFDGASSQELTELLVKDKDIIVIATPHTNIDYQTLISYNKPILDTKNALKDYSSPHIYRL